MSIGSALLWFLFTLLLLVVLERWIHRHLQGVCLLVLRDKMLATMMYALLFFPGVFIHESSHWVMAKLLQVRTAKFSIWPQHQKNGTLRLGYVETEKVDPVREAIIGAAPLLVGSIVIVSIGFWRLQIEALGAAFAAGQLPDVIAALQTAFDTADILIWLYLIFAISNSMLPSASDRRAWPVIAGGLLVLGVSAYLLDLTDMLMLALGNPLALAFQFIAIAFTITIVLNLLIMPLIFLAEQGLVRLTGQRVEYRQ